LDIGGDLVETEGVGWGRVLSIGGGGVLHSRGGAVELHIHGIGWLGVSLVFSILRPGPFPVGGVCVQGGVVLSGRIKVVEEERVEVGVEGCCSEDGSTDICWGGRESSMGGDGFQEEGG